MMRPCLTVTFARLTYVKNNHVGFFTYLLCVIYIIIFTYTNNVKAIIDKSGNNGFNIVNMLRILPATKQIFT